MVLNPIRRASPPRAVQKLHEDYYAIQILLSDPPSADWKRLFYDTQQNPPPEFPPRAIEITGATLRFRSDSSSIGQKVALLDRWIERANQKEASLGIRSEEERRRREETAKEQREVAALNERWAGL